VELNVAEFFYDYGLFTAKALTIILALVAGLVVIIAMATRSKEAKEEHIEIKRLNDRYDEISNSLKQFMASKDEAKRLEKAQKAKEKAAKKSSKEQRQRVFVLEFDGDIKASEVSNLREEVTAILMVAEKEDEVFIKLQSAGGLVHSYGLAASQLQRIREAGIPLTAAVDKVAASGGYMMACVAERIIAAPFAILGSIGVVAQMPNFNKLLKKHDVDYELITAGEYKRTLTMLGENTQKAREKFKEDIEDTHQLFKDFVTEHRPSVDISRVSTGEHWFGRRAMDIKLVDELKTSDDYLLERSKDCDLFEVSYVTKKALASRLAGFMQRLSDRLFVTWWTRANEKSLF
jgi:serine protease SohB